MAEALSQSQIDALLKGMQSGNVETTESSSTTKKLKEYDFKSPKKFTKEQLRTLDSLHENLSRVISSYLSGVLRVFCEVTILQIEEQRYYEYSNALPDSALIGMIDIRPDDDNFDEANLIIDMTTSIGFFMVDRLLGGSGNGYNLKRDFTEVELAIIEYIYQKFSVFIQDAWCSYINVKAKLTNIETNSRLVQSHSPEDIVVIVVMDMKIRDINGTLSICIPAINLEAMIENFSAKFIKTAKKQDIGKEMLRKNVIMDSLTASNLELKVILDELQIDLHDILKLQSGDVIPLNKGVNQDLDVTVDEITWFKAKMGQTKLKKAIKITEIL